MPCLKLSEGLDAGILVVTLLLVNRLVILLPTIQSQIKDGFTTEPQVTCFEVDHLQEA